MSLQTPTWIKTNFELLESSLNGDRSSFVHGVRRRALEALSSNGLPSPKMEDWKYTNIAPVFSESRQLALLDAKNRQQRPDLQKLIELCDGPLLVFVNGLLDQKLSRLSSEKDLEVLPISGLLKDQFKSSDAREVFEKTVASSDLSDSLAALSTAFLTDGAFIRIRKGAAIDKPIHVIFSGDVTDQGKNGAFSAARIVIVAEEGSQAKVIQSFIGSSKALTNSFTQVQVDASANLELYKFQLEEETASHLSGIYAVQGERSIFGTHLFSFGGDLVRNEVKIKLDGQHCETLLNGLTVLGGKQHVDNFTVLDHAKPNCQSIERIKGIYAGKSHGVFCGTIIVQPDAQKTNAIQSNNSVLLSNEASIDSKPQLKIWADDVKCTHGATVGQLDEDGIFYLRSRGLSYSDARNLMIHAFASDLIKEVKHPRLRDFLEETLMSKLAAISAA